MLVSAITYKKLYTPERSHTANILYAARYSYQMHYENGM